MVRPDKQRTPVAVLVAAVVDQRLSCEALTFKSSPAVAAEVVPATAATQRESVATAAACPPLERIALARQAAATSQLVLAETERVVRGSPRLLVGCRGISLGSAQQQTVAPASMVLVESAVTTTPAAIRPSQAAAVAGDTAAAALQATAARVPVVVAEAATSAAQ